MDSYRTASVGTPEHDAVRQMNGNSRVGPFPRRYGWLNVTYWPDGWGSPNQIRARQQHFWTRTQ